MLSNRRRRYVLYYLDHHEGPVELSDLAERIAARENDIDAEDVTYKQRKRVYTSLHQTHLPKLHDAGIVDYDRDRGTITLAERAADLDRYLEVVGQHGIPWCDVYLGLSALSLLALLAAVLGVVSLSGLALAGLVVTLFVAAAGTHAYLARRNRIGGGDAPIDLPED